MARSSTEASADVIVVGAGAAGCVVAARLTADHDLDVLLVEEGPATWPEAHRVPGRAGEMQRPPNVRIHPTPQQAGLGGRVLEVLSAVGIGGGTAVNSMAWFQGHPADYDGWASGGATGWGWDRVLPFMRRAEDHELGPSARHGAGGPMTVTSTSMLHPLSTAFVQSAETYGLPVQHDLDGSGSGVGLIRSTIRGGRRWDVTDGYLGEHVSAVRTRTGSAVREVLFNRSRAVGVRFEDGSEVSARVAVVLCAGAIGTPELLMRSGIGPRQHLEEHGIASRRDLPGVGQNLHDHPLVPVLAPVRDAEHVRGSQYADAKKQYETLRRGPLAAGGQVAALVRASDSAAPELQLIFAPIGTDAGADSIEGNPVAGFAALLTPVSRGTVRFSDASAASPLVVDPRYLAEEADRDRLREGMQHLLAVFRTEPLASHLGDLIGLEAAAGDDALDAYVAGATTPYWHLVGSARMGTGAGSVVDPLTMAVHGLDRLHVVDASVIPTITRGNIQAPVIAVAERAVPLLREAWST